MGTMIRADYELNEEEESIYRYLYNNVSVTPKEVKDSYGEKMYVKFAVAMNDYINNQGKEHMECVLEPTVIGLEELSSLNTGQLSTIQTPRMCGKSKAIAEAFTEMQKRELIKDIARCKK